jgi:hypothetical protein
MSTADIVAAAAQAPAATPTPVNDDLIAAVERLQAEVASMRKENNDGHASNAAHNGKTARVLERAASYAGGDTIGVSVEMRARA